ncbi:MAG TPA: HAD-IA family hydrolase [Azospirillaceae bacterium]|nr:HAD-IA family hydrolase [Azospirillaceae bacterium]
MPPALLFDLDGTLCNTDAMHFHALRALLREHGRDIDEEGYRRLASGRSNRDLFATLFPGNGEAENARLADRKEALFRGMADRLAPLPGLGRLLDWADDAGLGLALVTNAPRANVDHILAALRLEGRFHALVLGDELPRSKPDPLPYLTGLERLGARAEDSLAFEDSVPGLTAARAAGIPTVGIATTHDPAGLLAAGARIAVADFEAPDLWRLAERLLQERGVEPR